MPVYEYSCPACGDFEVTQRISDRALRRCPKCRRAVTKLISASSFQLKGSGWYVTDYGRKGNGKQSQEKKPAKSAGDVKSAGKKESAKEASAPAGKSGGESATD